MADKKISALTGASTPLAGTEVLPIVQSGATVKVAVSDLTAGRATAMSSLVTGTWTTSAVSARNVIWDGAQVYQSNDGNSLLGFPSFRWNTVYATTGTINTSDVNEKQDIAELDDAEKRVAVAIKSLIKKYRFKDAVVKKGDDARIHIGAVAQEVQAAFVAENLDPFKYGMFCSDTWYEVGGKATDENNVFYTQESSGAVQKTRLGLRYEELLAFVIAAL